MKYRYYLLYIFVACFFSNVASAQLVGDNAFLKGGFLQAGIAPNGSWGNTMPVPAGYTTRTSGSVFLSYTDPITGTTPAGDGLDFSYNQGHDGWTTWYGCYFLPGTPFDGWSIQIDDTMASAFYSSHGFDTTLGGNFGGTVTEWSGPSCWSPHAATAGTWRGTYGLRRPGLRNAMKIAQVNEIDSTANWCNVTTKFYNTSDSVLRGVYYMATADPDNDVTLGGSYSTDNHISYQGGALNRHEVNAVPNPGAHPLAFSGLATQDCRAQVLIYQSWPPSMTTGNNLDRVWAHTTTGMGTVNYALGATTVDQDIAYGLVFNVGNIAPHDSAYISYAWIFSDTGAVDSLFLLKPQLSTLGHLYNPGDRDSVFGCNLTGCDVINDSFFVARIINAENRKWTFSNWSWTPAVGLSAVNGTQVTINVTALTAPTTYTITGTPDTVHGPSCEYPAPMTFTLYVQPCFSASTNIPCLGDTLKLIGAGDTIGATFRWYGPGGYVGTGQSTYRYPVTYADTGIYHLVKTRGSNHDTATTDFSIIKPLPVVVATSNGPICSGAPNTLYLYANPDSVGETFLWTGPNGFTSTLEYPSIPNPPVIDGGIYKVMSYGINGCHDSMFLLVVIDSTPAVPTVTGNAPICSSHPQGLDTLKLYATDVSPGSTFSWAGPSGFTSLLQNPIIPQVHVPASGIYTVTVSIPYDGITCLNKNTINVVIDSTPYLPVLGSNAPICSGNALLLTATSTDLSGYNWWGPNAFTSGLQNPVITPATTLATGVYTVTATIVYPGGVTCVSDSATLLVVVDSTPAVPGITSNSPNPPGICQGDTLFLYSSDSTASVGYSWVGPNTFSSTLQNPFIAPVTPAATGVYTVTAILGMCSSSAVTTVTITPTPILTVSNNGPICTGVTDTLFLQAASNPGTTFSWTGPYTFVNNTHNPYRTPVIMEYGGIYQAIAYLNGCPSVPVNDTVITVLTPPAPWISWLTYCQTYDVNQMQAFGDSILWYPNSQPGALGTLVAPVPPSTSDTVMWFFVRQTNKGCTSALDSFKVTINPKPVVTVSPNVGVCPHDTAMLTAVDTDPIAYYHWAPNQYISDTVGATVIIRPETNLTYTVVATNKYGCTDTAYTNVSVKPAALLKIDIGDSVILYPGETFQLDPMTNCSYFTWFPPAGLSNDKIANPVASPQISTKYTVDGLTSWGCKATDSVNVYINDGSVLALPNAFSPGNGPNNEFKILLRGIANLQYFRIFDRWGVKVFETTDISKGWDGTFNGTPQPFGVYVYEVGAVTAAGHTFSKHGNVTLIR